MKRYMLVPRIGTGQRTDMYRADVAVPWVLVARLGNHWLVKVKVADAAAADAMTIADLDTSHRVVKSQTITVAQRNALRSWLTSQGYDATNLTTAIQSRQDLLLFVVHTLGGQPDMSLGTIIRGHDLA